MILPVLVVAPCSCSHTSTAKTAPAQSQPVATNSIVRRMDEQMAIMRNALSPSPNHKITEKESRERQSAFNRSLNSNQNKMFSTTDYGKKYYDANTIDGLKMFPTHNSDVGHTSWFQDKRYETKSFADSKFLDNKMFDSGRPNLENKTYETKKFGLRDQTDWQSKRVNTTSESSDIYTRQQLGKPTKATEVIDPAPGFAQQPQKK